MNKTFKVVFNRARGALMVANEITSSVQKKGAKTVLAAAILSLLGASAYAEGTTQYADGDFTFNEDTTISTTTASGENNRYSGIAAIESGKTTTVTVATGKTLTINGKLEDVDGAERLYLVSVQPESTVITNGNIVGKLSTESTDTSISLRGIRANAGDITMSGNLNLTINAGKGASNGAEAWDGAKLIFNGSTTD